MMYSDLDSDCTLIFSFTGSWMTASFYSICVCSSKQHRCKPGSEKRCQRNKNHGWKSGNMLCLLPMTWAQRKSSIETVLGWIKSKIIIKKLRSRRFCNFLKTHKFHAVSKITFRQLLNKLARLMLLKFLVIGYYITRKAFPDQMWEILSLFSADFRRISTLSFSSNWRSTRCWRKVNCPTLRYDKMIKKWTCRVPCSRLYSFYKLNLANLSSRKIWYSGVV